MRTWIATLLAGLILLAGPTGCGNDSDNGKVELRLATVLPADHPSCQALAFFRDRLAELSQGRLDLQLFLNSQLGGDAETIEFVQAGNIEMVYTNSASMAQFEPAMNALCMPYVFRDMDHLHHAVDGPVGQALSRKLAQINLQTLCWFDAGTRNVMTKDAPVPTPADLQGLKIRVQQSPLSIDALNAMGAAATPMTQGEVYTSLQTGRLDGWENNPPTCLSFKMYETGCRFFTWTNHLAIPDVVLINKNFYDNLDPQLRSCLEQAARETTDHQRQLWASELDRVVAQLTAAGMTFHHADTEAYRNRVAPLYSNYQDRFGPDFHQLCQQIRTSN